MTISQIDINTSIHSLIAAGMPISINSITVHLTDSIVNNYDGVTLLFVYKASWYPDIIRVVKTLGFNYVRIVSMPYIIFTFLFYFILEKGPPEQGEDRHDDNW